MRGIIFRLVLLAAAYFLFMEGFDDMRFNMALTNPKEYTLEELENTPKEEIPRYIKVKDIKIFTDSYVETANKKSGSLQSITYPVFSLASVESLEEGAAQIPVSLLIHDSNVTREQVEGGSYFEQLGDVVEGKYDGSDISSETQALFAESGYILKANAISLSRGAAPWGYGGSIGAMIGAILLALGVIYTFIPKRNKAAVPAQQPA